MQSIVTDVESYSYIITVLVEANSLALFVKDMNTNYMIQVASFFACKPVKDKTSIIC